MMLVLTIYFLQYIVPVMLAPLCRPTLSAGQIAKPEIGGYISLECEISTCTDLTKIVFEKADLNMTWIPIFEGVSQTYNASLDKATAYTLDNRNDYHAFPTKHSLHINPLILRDHGKWRCVVYYGETNQFKSEPLDFDIYVPPADGNFSITQNDTYLVINQQEEFTCTADGVIPQPDIVWEVNGEEYKGNITAKQREDLLWVVINTERIDFDSVGVKQLNCVMKTKARDPWLIQQINIVVQEPAFVLYPQYNTTETVNVYSTFSLVCRGSGYRPKITWNRDVRKILTNDIRYIIQEECDEFKCEGSLTSKPMDPALACVNTEQYAGLYSCIISLAPPFNSYETSASFIVSFSDRQCKDILGQIIGLTMLSFVCVAFLVCGIGFEVRRKKKRNKASTEQDEATRLLVNVLECQECITPLYGTENWLEVCGQQRSYDNVVLFDYGSNSVYIHTASDLRHDTKCPCNVKIYAIIRASHDMFVVTELETHVIRLLQLRNEKFDTLDTMVHAEECFRILICAENESRFIMCVFTGDYLLHNVIIYRVIITDGRLTSKQLTPTPVPVHGEPGRVSLIGNSNELVIVTLCGKIHTGNLQNYSAISDEGLVHYIDGGVRSLFIDKHRNLIIGTRGGQIHLYTSDKKHTVVQVGEPVRGITESNGQLIVCCGHDKKQQQIKVFTFDQIYNR